MAAAHEVVVVGPASWNHLVAVDHLPEPTPHMQLATGHRWTLGGTSAGKALHLTQRGRSTVLATAVGTDDAAHSVVDALREAGVPLLLETVDGPSEQHLNLMAPDGGRVSIYLSTVPDGGAQWRGPVLAAAAQARAVVLDLSPRAADVIDDVVATGVPVWTDLHDYDGASAFHRPFLEAASWMVVSRDRLADPWEFLRSVAGGPRGRTAVCTLGADGAIAVGPDGREHRVAAEPVDAVVDTNGAGDGFVAGVLDATLAGAPLEAALRAGAEQGARAVRTPHLCDLLDPLLPA
ncbi:carbohydrate kinase family protein [Cellulomonas sp. APG4]|uniref:carbohydrate kinase family protein n=1 Tax=Cellulomonas sp. APG4 TaxID=1538656 RepID=UPI00351AB4A9